MARNEKNDVTIYDINLRIYPFSEGFNRIGIIHEKTYVFRDGGSIRKV